MEVQEVEKKLDEAKKKQADLKTQLAETETNLVRMKGGYEEKVRNGADEPTLDRIDAELFKLDRDRVRLEIRVNQAGVDIEDLFAERERAHALEDRAKYDADVEGALAEAKDIEQMVLALTARAALHSVRLNRMKAYTETHGAQAQFRLVHLERRITAIFHGGHSADRAYKQPYDELLTGIVANANRQMPVAKDAVAKDAVAGSESTTTGALTETIEAVG